jgi:hypothetical protein
VPIRSQLQSGGVAFLGGAAAFRAYPNIWTTEAAAAKALQRASGHSASLECPLVKFRLPGRSQRWQRAYVEMRRHADPRRAIEALLGELDGFEFADKSRRAGAQTDMEALWNRPFDAGALTPEQFRKLLWLAFRHAVDCCLTQEELARFCGIGQGAFSNLMRGGRRRDSINVAVAEKAWEFLGLDPIQLRLLCPLEDRTPYERPPVWPEWRVCEDIRR